MIKIAALLLSVSLVLSGSPVWAEGDYVPVRDRRYEIDVRLESLDIERSELSLTGPKIATWVGVAFMLGGAAALTAAAIVEDDDCNVDGCPSLWGARATGRVMLPAGGLTALVSGIIWGVRAERRREIDSERRLLNEERDGLAAALSRLEFNSTYRDDTHFVTLGLRF